MKLLIGPITKITTGQSIAFKFLLDHYPAKDTIVINNTPINNRIVNALITFIRLSLLLTFQNKRIEKIYLSGSRSLLGIIKDLPIFLFQKKSNYQIFNHLHGFEIYEIVERNTLKNKILYLFLKPKKGRELIVLDEILTEKFKPSEQKFVTVIENFYQPIFEREIDLRMKNNQIIYFSNLMYSKGILDFLEAAMKVLNKNQTYSFVIAGDFVSDEYMSSEKIRDSFFKKLNLMNKKFRGKVTFLGKINGNSRVEVLQGTKIFVLPTFYKTEAKPLSIIEAMRMGNAIISTNHNLIPKLITNENGGIIKPKDTEQLADIILNLIQKPDYLEKVMLNNLNQATIKYSPENHLREIKTIF